MDSDYRKTYVARDVTIGLCQIANKKTQEDYLSAAVDEVKSFGELASSQQIDTLHATFEKLQLLMARIKTKGPPLA